MQSPAKSTKKIKKLLHTMRHDLEKPRATAVMFIDVLDEVIKDPTELAIWKKNLLNSFDEASTRLTSIELELQKLVDA